jgi:hypothetical protein
MYIEVTIESKSGNAYAYEVKLEFNRGESGDRFQPSVPDSYEVISVIKHKKEVWHRFNEKIRSAIQDECDRVMENY